MSENTTEQRSALEEAAFHKLNKSVGTGRIVRVGVAARVGQEGTAAQHRGLGRSLVARACELSREAGFERINVISAIGTREYYRHLGFYDHGLYLQKEL